MTLRFQLLCDLRDWFQLRIEWCREAKRFRFFYDDAATRIVYWARWAESEYGKDTRLSHRCILYGLQHL